MPVDKFERGEASIIQHTIVSSGDHADDVYLRRDGGNAAIGSISMTGNTVTNVCNPTVDHDHVVVCMSTRSQVMQFRRTVAL